MCKERLKICAEKSMPSYHLVHVAVLTRVLLLFDGNPRAASNG
jgi:hypothetical protein